MSDLDQQFQEAVKAVQNAPKTPPPSDEIRLDFYAYYKQATLGDIPHGHNTPSVFWFKDRAKWDAWNSLKGLTKDQAKQVYVKLTHQYIAPTLG